MQTPSKRKGVGVMELVSDGSPQKFFARENQCHRVSPTARRQADLRTHQVGIKKSLTRVFSEETDLASLIREAARTAVVKALEEEREKNLIFEDDLKKKLVTGITIRSLVSDWSKTSGGKEDLRKMAQAVNQGYEKGVRCKQLPYNRRVMHGDLLSELKHLTKTVDQDMAAHHFMATASGAIEDATKLSGVEFLQMVQGYVQANEQVHVQWTHKKLLHVVELVERGELQIDGSTPAKWICHMADMIAQAHGWPLVGPPTRLKKPKQWSHSEPITRDELKRMRDEFWDTAPHSGGSKEIWEALQAAAKAAKLSVAQAIIDRAGIIATVEDMSLCYDARGAKYELPSYVLSEPTNLIKAN